MNAFLFAAALYAAPAQTDQFEVIVVEGAAPQPAARAPQAIRATRDVEESPIPVRTNFRERLLSSAAGL